MLLVLSCLLAGLALVGGRHSPTPPNMAKCVHQLNECQCIMDSGKMLDLRYFDSNSTLKPAFGGGEPGYNCSYLYNPCTPFTNNGTYGCQTAAVCQIIPGAGSFNAGYHPTATFMTSWKYGLYVRYHTIASGVVLTSKVYLGCIPEDKTEFKIYGELPEFGSGTSYFQLNSKRFCF